MKNAFKLAHKLCFRKNIGDIGNQITVAAIFINIKQTKKKKTFPQKELNAKKKNVKEIGIITV